MLTEELKDDASSLKDGASSLEDGAPPADDAADRGSEFFRAASRTGASRRPGEGAVGGSTSRRRGYATRSSTRCPCSTARRRPRRRRRRRRRRRDAAGNKVRGLHPGPSLTESGFERKIAAAFPPPQPLGDNGFTENQRRRMEQRTVGTYLQHTTAMSTISLGPAAAPPPPSSRPPQPQREKPCARFAPGCALM
ncbi:hypothetical protein JL721_10338 [Aureococcus anophagefferens]|nr:hypothetical protein JL721_10338 [Aureococcus anophagefferens]